MSDKFNVLEMQKKYGRVPSRRTVLADTENHKLRKHHIDCDGGDWGVWIARSSEDADSESLQKAIDFCDKLNEKA